MGAIGDKQVRAAAVGADKVMQIWEAMNDGNPYFAVYYNQRNKYFQYNKNDLEAAKNLLDASLQAIEATGDNSMYYLNIYSEPMANYPNSGMVASFPFRLNAFRENESGAIGGVGEFTKALQDAHTKQLELVTQLAEAKAANAPLDWWDKISGIMETPGAAQTLVPLLAPVVGMITGLMQKISGIPAVQYPAPMPPGIAGPQTTEDKDELLDAALDRLSAHGDLVELITTLADFADKQPAQFKMYFSMLKGQS